MRIGAARYTMIIQPRITGEERYGCIVRPSGRWMEVHPWWRLLRAIVPHLLGYELVSSFDLPPIVSLRFSFVLLPATSTASPPPSSHTIVTILVLPRLVSVRFWLCRVACCSSSPPPLGPDPLQQLRLFSFFGILIPFLREVDSSGVSYSRFGFRMPIGRELGLPFVKVARLTMITWSHRSLDLPCSYRWSKNRRAPITIEERSRLRSISYKKKICR